MMDQFSSIERLAGGFQFTEGPVWIPALRSLLFSDIPASRIYRWRDGTVDMFREPSGQANGNTLDRQGQLITCEHANRRVSRTNARMEIETLADRFEGKRLNSPNDVVCRSDGMIYFTDPPYGVPSELRELDFQGVYRISGSDALPVEPVLLVRDFAKPNGLALSPDETILYVADTERNHVRAFDVKQSGSIGNGHVFCAVDRPDGMRVDVEGNLYVAGTTGIEVFNSQGEHKHSLAMPERPANLAFGGTDYRTLFVTARTSLYRLRMPIAGISIF